MYAEQVGKLDVGGLRHQHTARFNDLLVIDGFKDIVQRALGEVVGINTGKHRFRHIVFHENQRAFRWRSAYAQDGSSDPRVRA